VICVACHRGMRCQKNGVMVRYPSGNYRAGDRYECGTCKRRVVAGLSRDSFPLNNVPPSDLLEIVEVE